MASSSDVVAGRFRLLGPIGKGNMGEVHRAEDLNPADDADGHIVAMKRILRGRSGAHIDSTPGSKAAERFNREVRSMRRLDHPNLPRIVDGGVAPDGLAYLAMEFLDGHALYVLAEQQPIPISWVAALGAQIADGLFAAHGAGVIHRDLKPANVMLLRGGTVKVLDFGLARITDDTDSAQLTSTGTTVGTAHYMAPEQVRALTVGQAADLYALGCVLFELLTGSTPFDADSAHELRRQHLHEQPPPLRTLRPDVPRELTRLVESLLAKEPAERPVDAKTVRDVLRALADGAESPAGWEEFDPVAGLARISRVTPMEQSPIAGNAQRNTSGMDVFGIHRKLIEDYRAFTESGTLIRDNRVAEFVERDLDAQSQWPNPWLSLNPSFAPGGTVAELAAAGVLHEECTRIFQADKSENSGGCDGQPLTLRRHQREAIDVARAGESYVLSTGTGSGKSLAYIVPIVDRVLRQRREEDDTDRRVRAIVVYPMNSLANSQLDELRKYLVHGYGEGNQAVTFERYTGQESDQKRREIRDNPPDILLTNYMMLELMLTRPDDRRSLIAMAGGLEFLVLDELHTYRGRQGADVALLVRRVREACRAENLQCVGTSATMSSEGSFADQQEAIARVGTMLFGTPVRPGNVIGETLERATDESPETVSPERLCAPQAPRTHQDLVADPLARWIETRFGVITECETGRLVRQRPAKIEDAAAELAPESGLSEKVCAEAIRDTLTAGSETANPTTGRGVFAFRLHQFLSKGDTVYVTLEDKRTRHLTREYQRVLPGSDGKILLPLAFCRECGQEYLTVWRCSDDDGFHYEPRQDTIASGGEEGDGYLYIDHDRPWPVRADDALAERRLPESWLHVDEHGNESVRESQQKRLPRAVTVDAYGTEGHGDLAAAFIPAPFLFCLHCGVSYEQSKGKDFARLATLSQEGRSSATSLVSASIVRSLKDAPDVALDDRARKLLTFVDNRQDASLQAGHFNDFVQTTQLRAALYRAMCEAGEEGLQHEELATRVTEALGLDLVEYAGTDDLSPSLFRNAVKTLRDVVAFRLYCDLQSGWRVTMPNLEQTGLLEMDYADLEWIAANERKWTDKHPELKSADPGQRVEIMRALLNQMRWSLAIDVSYFRDDFETLRRATEERLVDPWVLSKSDFPWIATAYPQSSTPGMDRSGLFLSGRSKLGKFLRRKHFPQLSVTEAQHIIAQLLELLADAQLLHPVRATPQRAGRNRRSTGSTITGYRIAARALIWRAGNGETGMHDPVSRTYASGDGPRVNTFFRDLYRSAADALGGMSAREHTAQVDPDERQRREKAFGNADLKLLYCSPTLELGVDIAELNAVMMRNVPPTPANYAQRSGRAGRSGQPALVTTYCATGNSHDQYYFRHSDRMVAGSVAPPRLDLANRDLVRSHVQAIWLAECGIKLGRAIPHIIDIGYAEDDLETKPELPLHEHVADATRDPAAQRRAVTAARQALSDSNLLDNLSQSPWWHEQWIEETVRVAPREFNRGFDRWRELFRAALLDQAEQNRRVLDHTLSERDRRHAVGRRKEAETQLNLLKNEGADSKSVLSDFNPYRYLASEGFLPGYSFPRLPLAAYVPPSGRRNSEGDYLQRPRFLAIREFGPGALIYHEGARYQVTRVQLPADTSDEALTTTARRCASCGYHHEPQHNADNCQFCDAALGSETQGLLWLRTVYTHRRERISSDEEERRKAGYRLVTSYRFHGHGERSGRLDATVADSHGTLATVSYGDSATVRITNLGRRRAAKNEPDGFWLDPDDGRWMNESDAANASGDSSEMPVVDADGNEKRRKKRVLPYVEDRRNILVLRLAEALPESAALSLMYALERGIEAAFELEDAELTSELLPPEEGERDRMLFTEAAEGGAGVLRLMQSDRGKLARAAATALDICHFAPDGTDRGGAEPDRPCARGCYECLLTYGNQHHHGAIDRHAISELLVRLADAGASPEGRGESRPQQLKRLTAKAETGLERELATWLSERGLRLPDDAQTLVPEARARPDFVYFLRGASVAVFVDGPVHEYSSVAQRDVEAEDRLLDNGWEVVRFPHDGDWSAIVEQLTQYFGSGVDT